MMRVGEVTESPHVLKAKNVHIAMNKDKLLFILYISKMHVTNNRPQKIKITSSTAVGKSVTNRHFCPFTIVHTHLRFRGGCDSETDQFFIFKGNIPLKAKHLSGILKTLISRLGLDNTLYSVHSFRIG